MLTPRLFLLLSLIAFPLGARAGTETSQVAVLPEVGAGARGPGVKLPVVVSSETVRDTET